MMVIPTRTKATEEMSYHARKKELAMLGGKETSRSVPAQKCWLRTHEMGRGGQKTWRAHQNMIVLVKSWQRGSEFLYPDIVVFHFASNRRRSSQMSSAPALASSESRFRFVAIKLAIPFIILSPSSIPTVFIFFLSSSPNVLARTWPKSRKHRRNPWVHALDPIPSVVILKSYDYRVRGFPV